MLIMHNNKHTLSDLLRLIDVSDMREYILAIRWSLHVVSRPYVQLPWV